MVYNIQTFWELCLCHMEKNVLVLIDYWNQTIRRNYTVNILTVFCFEGQNNNNNNNNNENDDDMMMVLVFKTNGDF